MTPLEIEIMLHHYYSPAEWPKPSPAATSDMMGLAKRDLLKARPDPEGDHTL